MTKKNKARGPSSRLLVGRWVSVDEWRTEIMFVISKRRGLFQVRAIDQSDGERAEIYGVNATRESLSFAAYWSSGQFTKYRLRAIGSSKGDYLMEAVFTYSDTTHFRREKKPSASTRKKRRT